MIRTITLSLLILATIGVSLPFVTTAHGIRQSSVSKRHRHYRHHSRAWWRRHRARLRRYKAAMAHRNAPLTPNLVPANQASNAIPNAAPVLPVLPDRWTSAPSSASELRFLADSTSNAGKASLSVVALSRPTPAFLTVREQRKYLSGVAIVDLRRIVIDKMISAGGWVTNDYVRALDGKRVYVVTAHTPADGRTPEEDWNFYFTEINGRIYSLATDAPSNSADRMAGEAEQFLHSLDQRLVAPAPNSRP
jgi:hypothetical protein